MKFVFSLLVFLMIPFAALADHTEIFTDNFNDTTITKWIVSRNTCSSASWSHSNGKYGISINNPGSCVTESMPSDEYWNSSINDYIFEVDITPTTGTDKNIAWRYSSPTVWVDIHIMGTSPKFQRLTLVNSSNIKPIINGNTYHFKIQAIENTHKVWYYNINSPEDVSYMEGTNIFGNFLTGRPALQASVGGDTTSSVWFDNVKVTQIHTGHTLTLPHFSQFDPSWKDVEYDSASSYNPIGLQEIGDWGCALTSAAMILNYHGYDTTPTGEATTPKTLNAYLNNNNGYARNGGVIWNKITSFTTHASTHSAYLNKNLPKLELNYQLYDKEILEADLEATNPAILKVVTKDHGTMSWSDDNLHFITASGIQDQKIFINDPLDLIYEEATISANYANKEIRHMVRFAKSYTDQSYFTIYAYNPNANILLEIDSQKFGVDSNGNEHNLNLISYYEEGAIASPNDFINRFGGNSMAKVLQIPKPVSGNYKITISDSTQSSTTPVEIHLFDQNGESLDQTLNIETTPSNPTEREFYFDKENIGNSQIEEVAITLEDLIETIQNYENKNQIDSKFANRLKNLVQLSIKFRDINFIKNVFLNRIAYLVDRYSDAQISNEAKLEINSQIQSLKDLNE